MLPIVVVTVILLSFSASSSMGFVLPSPATSSQTERTQGLDYARHDRGEGDFTTTDNVKSTFFSNQNNKNNARASTVVADHSFAVSQMKSWEMGIFAAETELRRAMLRSDVAALDCLLDDEFLFVNQWDQIMTKADDIEAHRRRIITLERIDLTNWNIDVIAVQGRPHLACVTVDAHIVGALGAHCFEDDLRIHRVWRRTAGRFWQVLEGDSSFVLKD